jgi:uncharacterized membrane protein
MGVKKRLLNMPDKTKKSVKKASNNNKSVSVSNNSINKKLDLILGKLDSIQNTDDIIRQDEEKLLREEEKLLLLEEKGILEESTIEKKEDDALEELKKIESLEQDIKEGLKESPLKRITYKDITKGIIGAFFGVVGHFAFAKGPELAETFSFFRSTLLFIVSFVIILLFLYFSGFKSVNDKLFLKFFPLRAFVIYFSAIITIIVVLLLYGKIYFTMSFEQIYNTVAAISLLAVMGAATADLIGKNE